ncbi:hypothetical protein CBR_g41186 [Chara braunii]|uniref:Uncharacterized protein n=1 Tax=Chara braunii TaxID=69332 RepID=A0A388K2M0_CHABU|nr:hypothetical protein CBR_g41186 [Chara braunii]|eukprot:GBG64265.1 hypothetical protein CBR_g41186 [Chara braunii]
MRLTLRTTINAVPRVSPMMAGTLRMISWDEPTEGKPSTDDAESSDEDDPEILKLPGHQELIAQEFTIPVAQLADDLPLDILSQDDEHPIPHVLSRTLMPYLQWSACVEGAAEPSRCRSRSIWIPRRFAILPSSGIQRRSSLLPFERRKRRKKALRVTKEKTSGKKVGKTTKYSGKRTKPSKKEAIVSIARESRAKKKKRTTKEKRRTKKDLRNRSGELCRKKRYARARRLKIRRRPAKEKKPRSRRGS